MVTKFASKDGRGVRIVEVMRTGEGRGSGPFSADLCSRLVLYHCTLDVGRGGGDGWGIRGRTQGLMFKRSRFDS